MKKNKSFLQITGSMRLREIRKLREVLQKSLTILDDPSVVVTKKVNTRQNNLFGITASLGKEIRNSLAPLLENVRDITQSNRLMKILMKIVTSTKAAGSDLSQMNFSILKGFKFNQKSCIDSVFRWYIHREMDRDTGQVKINIPEFDPWLVFNCDKGVTHYQFMTACIEVEPGSQKFNGSILMSSELVLDKKMNIPLTLVHSVTPGSELPVLLVVGIKFYSKHGEILYPCYQGKIPVNVMEVFQPKTEAYGTKS